MKEKASWKQWFKFYALIFMIIFNGLSFIDLLFIFGLGGSKFLILVISIIIVIIYPFFIPALFRLVGIKNKEELDNLIMFSKKIVFYLYFVWLFRRSKV